MKTRIITDGEYFYPQRKSLFFWSCLYNHYVNDAGYGAYEMVYFNTLEKAQQYLTPKQFAVVEK